MDYADSIRLSKVKADFAVPFNLREVDGDFMVSNHVGDFLFLTPDELQRFVEGRTSAGDGLYERLKDKNLIAAEVDTAALRRRWLDRKMFLNYGPTLHAFVLTHRCNHGCQYCHSSIVPMSRTDTDMSIEVAEKAVDFAFRTTSPGLTIEFQGGEPTANWGTLQHIVEYAKQKNKIAGKALSFSLVTNFTIMDDDRMEYLLDRKVQVCTSLDGPEDIHNDIRIWKGGNAYENVTYWMQRFNQRYRELGLDPNLYRVEALPTITKPHLGRHKDIVDEYIKQGCRAIFLRILDPFGFAARSAKRIGYTIDQFMEFYRNAFEYILELNKQGVQVMERHAAIMLSKMIGGYEPNYLDLRSPGGAAIGQLGYGPDGRIFTSDEGRMVEAMGDDMFNIGTVDDDYRSVMMKPAVRAMVMASTSEGQPGCVSCVYKPYCGLQPEFNFKTQGSIFGSMADSHWCRRHKSVFDYLAYKLKTADDEEREIMTRWTINRPQEHFLQRDEETGAPVQTPDPLAEQAAEQQAAAQQGP